MADGQDSDDLTISDKVVKELNDTFKTTGVSGIVGHIQYKLTEWKRVPLNIAVVGSSGTGKSSFINTLRGLTADDKGAAAVGVVETTAEATPYPHPDNENLKLWDLPGVGTIKFPQKTYLEQTKLNKYDFFLIFSAKRFTEEDIWLAKQVQRFGKQFYFIRTKVDLDVINDKKAHPMTHSETDVLNSIRKHTTDHLQQEGFSDIKIYLINNHQKLLYDFGCLASSLIRDAPDLKRESLTLSLSLLAEDVIRQKEKILKKRIYLVSVASAVAAAVPIPGVGTCVDTAILVEEATFYLKQLQLDDRSLKRCAVALKIDIENMKEKFDLRLRFIKFTTKGLLAFCVQLGVSNLTENIMRISVPGIGSVIAAGLSYGTQVFCLRKLLNALIKDALILNRQFVQMASAQCLQ